MTRTSSLALALCFLGSADLAAQAGISLPFPLKTLEESAVRDSNDAAAHYNVALGYWSEKRWDEAEKALRLAMQLDGQFAEPHLALAHLPYARRPRLWDEERREKIPAEWKATMEESEREYRRAFYINPFVDLRIIGAVLPDEGDMWRFDYPELYRLIQQPYDDMFAGHYGRAYEGFDDLVKQWGARGNGPLPRHIYWFQTLCAARVGKIDEAMRAIDKLLKEEERVERREKDRLVRTEFRTKEFRYIKAILFQAQGKKDEAIGLFRLVLEEDIGMYMAHGRMATLYEGSQQWTEALAERQSAVNANPEDATLLVDLGVTAIKAGQTDLALDALTRAEEASPRLPDAPYWIGMIQLAQGKREEGKQSLNRFLGLAPSRWQAKIEMAKKQLAKL